MKYIIYPSDSNKLEILEPAVEHSIEECAAFIVAAGKPYSVVESSEIDLEFADLYSYDDGKAVVDIGAAKERQKSKFRVARTPLLAALDVEYLKADETSDVSKKQEIAAKKQALRDVTKTELPDDLAGIKATWPSILS